MKRLTFKAVKEALFDQKEYFLTTNVDARHRWKYTYQNIYFQNASISFKTLQDVVDYFELKMEEYL